MNELNIQNFYEKLDNKDKSKLNITGLIDKEDIHYRYKMNKLNINNLRNKIEIDNLNLICKDINRDPKYLIEFFKIKFATSFIFKNGRLSTTKNINYIEFELALKEFIEYFVICPVCRLPETEIKISKEITLFCKCCPYNGKLNPKNKIAEKTLKIFKK
ncbi:Translation initiation factor [uncultured virus]|nr:Translation initiation factor [uncultured virus]